MTIAEIAALCGRDESTVRRWVAKAGGELPAAARKMSAAGHGKAARFTLEETVAIVRAGGNNTLADLLMENAKRQDRADRIHRLPNGKQLEELRQIAGPRAFSVLCYIIGYSTQEAPADPDTARAAFEEIKNGFRQKQLDFDHHPRTTA